MLRAAAPLLWLTFTACPSYAPDLQLITGHDSGSPADAGSDAGAEVPDAGARRLCPADGGWVSLAGLDAGPRAEVGVAVLDTEIWVLGGFNAQNFGVATVEAYSYVTDSWRTAEPLPRALNHVNTAVVNGKLYALGGLDPGFGAVGSAWVLDPAAGGHWAPVAAMPAGTERGAGAVGVVDGKVIIAGGYRLGSVRDVSAYDPATDTWSMLPQLPAARDHLAGAVWGGVFYALGGRRNGIIDGRVDALEMGAGSWASKTAMLTPRAGSAAAVVDGGVIVFGGEGSTEPLGVFREVERYDFAADTWSSLESPPTPRHGTNGATIDGVAFFPGGAYQEGYGASAANEAHCP